MSRILLAFAAAICVALLSADLNPASAQHGYHGGPRCARVPSYSSSYRYGAGYSPYGQVYSYAHPGITVTRSSYYSGYRSPIYGPVPSYRYGRYGAYGNLGYGPRGPIITSPGIQSGIQLRIGF